MDGYLQTALVANGPPPPSRVSPSSTKLLKPCPPSNKEFQCDNVHTVEGTYQLVNEIRFDTIAPQFSSGTRTCIVDVRPKHLAKSTSSATTSTTTDSANASTPTPVSSSTDCMYINEDEEHSSTTTLSQTPQPPSSLSTVRSNSTPHILQQTAPQLSPSLWSTTTTTANSNHSNVISLTHTVATPNTLDSMGITRSTALPIPNVTARSYDSISSSFQPGTEGSNGTLTPPHSRTTPTSSIPTPHLPGSPAAGGTVGLTSNVIGYSGVTPTPTSSTPFVLHHPPHHHHPHPPSSFYFTDPTTLAPTDTSSSSLGDNNQQQQQQQQQHSINENGISDLSTSVSSLSALFSRRNSMRYLHSPQRKPKNNLAKTKSSFVLRMIIHDRLAHVLANRTVEDSFVFFNVGTSFLWMDANGKPKDPLSRIVFTKAYPTCHDVNLVTKSSEHLDVIIGFSSGDCVWYDPLTSKYFRLNKDGNMKRGSVTNVKWIPGSEDLFMASFSDGTILILDKDREDQAYTPASPNTWAEQQFHAIRPHKNSKYNPVSHWSTIEKGIGTFEFSPDGIHLAVLGMDGTLRIMDYHQERVLDIFASYYGNFLSVAWSPDGRYLLCGGQDDLVTIWSFVEKRIIARCHGHKSWVTKVAFDAYRCDDKVYRFGSVGEDCKLILWDFSFSALHRPKNKHRTTGNTPRSPRSPKDTHRFSFVGSETLKSRTPMLAHMFDRQGNFDANNDMMATPLSPTTLRNYQHQPSSPSPPPPPQQHHHHHHTFGFKKRSSTTTSVNQQYQQQHSHRFHSTSPTKLATFEAYHLAMPTLHPAPSKTQVPSLQPSTIRTVHADPCVDLLFLRDSIVTTDRRGAIRIWGRP